MAELVEIFHLVFVVAVEEDLVEAGEAEHFLGAVEFDLERDDASAGGGHIHIRQHRPGRDQHLQGLVGFFGAVSLARQQVDARHALADPLYRKGWTL